jgi:hypothetical protein
MIEGLVGVRRRRTVGEAMFLVAEYEASGMSRRAFCSGRGLAVATLDLYRKRAREGAARSGVAGARRLVAVEIERESEARCSPTLAVVLRNGRRIEVGGTFDSGVLTELLVVLERA